MAQLPKYNSLLWHSYLFKTVFYDTATGINTLYCAITYITCLIQRSYWNNLPYTAQLLI